MSMPSSPPTSEGLRRFPCKQCGAKLEFAPGTDHLVCPYCGADNEIGLAKQAGTVEELDYRSYLIDLEEHAEKFEHLVVRCDACGAVIEAPKNVSSFSCSFCGTNIVATAKSVRHIKPNAVLPFRMSREQAGQLFKKWIASRWFAPSALKRESFIDASVNGTYVPSWTFDAQTTTQYTGERGDAYYVTVTVMVNGRPTTQQQRRIRWTGVSGVVYVPFDDVLVMATTSVSPEKLDTLDPWDLKDCVPYDDAYLAGFRAEVYSIGLPEGFEVAKQKMKPVIVGAIESDIGGDEQRVSSMSTQYAGVTFKHVLLPVWMSAYRYQNTVYSFMVNARTGEVVGERPYSAIKITLAVIAGLILIAIIVLIASNR
jgi:predicted RNA-binding Zn-ribbon protein involved in translation (DUF1610 family)